MMTTVTTATKTKTTMTMNEDNDKETNGKDNKILFFDTTTNLWSDAFLAERGGDFEDYDKGNNNGRGEG